WRQPAFDLRPVWLQPRRPHQPRAEAVGGLIDRKPRPVGGDLKEHAAGLAEVDRMEPEPVDDVADGHARFVDLLPPLPLLLVVGRAPGAVVNCPDGYPAPAGPRRHVQVQPGSGPAGTDGKPPPRGRAPGRRAPEGR